VSARRLAQALECAREYRQHEAREDVVQSEAVSRTIDDLVGYYVAGQYVLPQSVAEAMGHPERGDDRCGYLATRAVEGP
jgi:hypothetical protein